MPDVIDQGTRSEVRVRLRAIRRWVSQALEGDCTEQDAVTAILGLGSAAQRVIDRGEG